MKVPSPITPRTQRATGGIPFIRNSGGAGTQSSAALAASLTQAGNAIGSLGGFLSEQAQQARRFGVLQNFSAFQTDVDSKLAELKRNANPAQGNFADQATAHYSNWEADWLKTIPDEFYDEFATRAADVKANVARDALAFQYERTDAYFKQGISDQIDRSLNSLDQDGSIANLDAQRAAIDEFIASTTLTEAEKVSLRRQAYTAIEKVSYKSEVRRGKLEISALGVGAAPGQAVDLILQFDGASLENGRTYAENQQLLEARVGEASDIALEAVGNFDRWAALPDRARAVLISIADDLGEIPSGVRQALDSGDLVEVAAAVAALSGTAGDRRDIEAQIILGQEGMPEGRLDADPRFANIPYEDRLTLRADAEREATAQLTAEQAQIDAQQKWQINDLNVGLYDGRYGQTEIDQLREAGVLTSYEDINRAQTILDKVTSDLRMTQLVQSMISAGMTLNPDDKDHRDAYNAYIGEHGLAALRERDGTFVTTTLVPSARELGDLPTETVGLLTGMIRSQDPQQALFALDTLSQLQQASPSAYDARVKEDVQADVRFWQSVKDYYPMEEVLATVRGGTTQEVRVRNEMLRKEAKDLLSDGTVQVTAMEAFVANLPAVVGQTTGWWQRDPIMAPGIQNMLENDFNQLFQKEYTYDGNEEAARDRAVEALQKVWRTTEIGGQPQLMRYPPEAVGYETWNGSYDWITEQGRQELGLNPGQTFQLISDEQTKAEFQAWQGGSGPRPSYLAVYLDEEGALTYSTRKEIDAEGNEIDTGEMQRIFFQITPEMQAEKETSFANAQRAQEYSDFMKMYTQARQHSLWTGTPIPAEIIEEYVRWQENPPYQRLPGIWDFIPPNIEGGE